METTTENRVWTKTEIKAGLMDSDRFLLKSLEHLYSLQTGDEKQSYTSFTRNKEGFNRFDASFLSAMALRVIEDRYITPNRMTAIRRAMFKYAGQLTEMANLGGW